ncbi:MAG: D-alanyl-D-alanine carboxypeptidase [Oscillospiraceae bacterium]|nr:D-alanyl-D-alanine carboxypeptidase [Oscillospiraceae bacterium]MBQ5566851.1 D-alanyl-D-alanine carboxypeptidase [Oscillospiraceae bacterium]
MKRLFALLCLTCLLLCVPAHADAPELNAPSALLMEKQTGTVLCAVGEHEAREPASVTKIMTLLLTMEAIDSGTLHYDDVVTASAHASSMGGSQIWLREGEQMRVEDLLKAVCVVSGNDAAVALGEHLSGSEDAFVEKMNRRAKELGMNDTHFVNCTGLPVAGHVTSAYDIALMSRELIAHHPDIRRFTTIWTDSLRDGASMLVNTNKLIRFYPGATGLKTGSTDTALYCLSATAERDGMELIAVVLKAPSSEQRFADARALLDYGFANYALVTLTPEQPLAPVAVHLGESAAVQPVLTEDNTLLLEKAAAAGMTQTVTMAEGVDAPVAQGDRLGELTVADGEGNTLAVLPILAGQDVPRLTWWQMAKRVLRCGFCAA